MLCSTVNFLYNFCTSWTPCSVEQCSYTILLPTHTHNIYFNLNTKFNITAVSYSTTNKMHLFLKLFILVKHSTCFGRSFRPLSGVQDCTYNNRHMSNSWPYKSKHINCLNNLNLYKSGTSCTQNNVQICWLLSVLHTNLLHLQVQERSGRQGLVILCGKTRHVVHRHLRTPSAGPVEFHRHFSQHNSNIFSTWNVQ
jgi:hypothetical protein